MNLPPPTEPRLDAVCAGPPRELGVSQGTAMAAKIHGTRRMLKDLEAFRLKQPWALPYPLFRWLAESKAARALGPALARHHPDMADRLAGLAEGARLPLPAIHLLNIFEPLLSDASESIAPLAGCSAVAVRGTRSRTGEPIIARNFDYMPLVQPYFGLRHTRPKGGFQSLDFIVAPLGGALDGVNERGLCLTYDYAFPRHPPPAPAPALSMILSEILAHCTTVEEAIRRMDSRPRWGGGLIMLADATGDLASLEVTHAGTGARRPEPGEDLIFHSNAFRLPAMREVEMPRDAVLCDRAPRALRGKRLHASAEARDARLAELTAPGTVFDPESLRQVMGDHGPEGTPSGHTPCVHSDYWFTTATMQYFPKTRRMRVSYAPPCQARYAEFGL